MYYGLFDLVCSNVPEEFNTVLVDSFFSIFIFLCSVFFLSTIFILFWTLYCQGRRRRGRGQGAHGKTCSVEREAEGVLWSQITFACQFWKHLPTFRSFPEVYPHFPDLSCPLSPPPHTHTFRKIPTPLIAPFWYLQTWLKPR